MWKKLIQLLIEVDNPDPEKPHRARLVNILLVGVSTLTLAVFVMVLFAKIAGVYSWQQMLDTYRPGTIFLLIIIGLHYLNNHSYSRLAAWLFLILMLAIFYTSDSPYESLWGRNMIFLAIPILMASVVLPPRASFGMAGLVAILFIYSAVKFDVPLNMVGISAYFAFALTAWLAAYSLEQVAHNLRVAKEDAEKSARVKSEFLANMSHEIRTPLNGILGMTQIMMDAELSSEQMDHLETISKSGDALLELINQILDFSKIESGHLELEEIDFDIRRLVGDTFKMLSSKAAQKELELAYLFDDDVPSHLCGDAARLRQILVNLIGNGIKFTDKGEIYLTVKCDWLVDGKVKLKFAVRDNGIGISKDKLAKLFKPFSQVDASMSRNFGGTGLGLSISRQLSEAMGGEIWVDSELGKGSTFFFTAVFHISQSNLSGANHLVGLKAFQNKLALVVDDNETNRHILAHRLSRWGMEVNTAVDGQDALEWLQHNKADIAIVDMQMPRLNGVELAQAYKSQNPNSPMPFIMFASVGFSKGDIDMRDLFMARLNKPINNQRLHSLLTRLFEEKPPPTIVSQKTANPELAGEMPLRILLADDNMINQKVASKMLERLGYKAEVVANGLEVLDAVESAPYDVILMDIQMPMMDGVEATKKIIEKYGDARPRIIAMTANAINGDREFFLSQGLDDYISKPISIEKLTDALKASTLPSS